MQEKKLKIEKPGNTNSGNKILERKADERIIAKKNDLKLRLIFRKRNETLKNLHEVKMLEKLDDIKYEKYSYMENW